MRLLIAMLKHETNTFSPVPTYRRRFEDWGLHRGEGVPAALAGTSTPTAAYLDLARAAGARDQWARMCRSWRSPRGMGALDLKACHRHSLGVPA